MSRGPTATEDRRAIRRSELLEAAERAIRREGPAASMEEIAAEAGVTKPILYRHFGDKGGLYQALAERYLAVILAELRAGLAESTDPPKRIAATIDAFLSLVEREPQAYRFLMQRALAEEGAHTTVMSFTRRLAGEIGGILRVEFSRAGLDTRGAEALAHGIVGMVALVGDWWLEERALSRDELVERLAALLWGGFTALPPAPGDGPA
jgi:AcrR family transcriptional regulator